MSMSQAPLPEPRPFTRPRLQAVPAEPLRYQCPELPSLETVAPYYALAEEARWYSNGGPCATLLTERLAASLGGDAGCLLVGNCTLGLMVALRAACLDPDARRRYVVTPSFTFAATAGAIDWAGYEPLFVDVDEASWQLDGDALAGALAAHPGEVAGVLACSTFGTPAPARLREHWRAVCAEHGVPLLVDSAAAFGAFDDEGVLAGAAGDTEIFSFHATKPFAIGEGGLVVTRDEELLERMTRLINFGFDPVTRIAEHPGFNAKLSEIHAAFGLAMLDRYDSVLERRRATASRIADRLAGSGLTYQEGAAGSTWQVFQTLVPTPGMRAAALTEAKALNVEARTCFDPPLHRHDAFASCPTFGSLQVTDRLAARALSLPLANELTDAQIERLVELVGIATETEERLAC
jgi:dTDP-4-amino-4,6-dideoxygalactose transaminase